MNVNPVIPAIPLFIAALAYDVITDYRDWKKNVVSGKKFDHKKGAIERVFCVLPSLILFTAAIDGERLWWPFAILIAGFMEFFVYMLFFNGFFAMAIKQNFFYNGTTSDTDKWWNKLGEWRKPLAIIMAVTGLVMYLFFLFR